MPDSSQCRTPKWAQLLWMWGWAGKGAEKLFSRTGHRKMSIMTHTHTRSCRGCPGPWSSQVSVQHAERWQLLRWKACSSPQRLSQAGKRGFLRLLKNCGSFWQSERSLPFWNLNGPLDSGRRGYFLRGVQCCYFLSNGSLQWL